MDSTIVYLVIAALIAALYIRKTLQMRGIPQYTPEEARSRMQQGSVLLDVRTPAERKQRSINGSLHIPLHELGSKMKSLERHRSREVIVYCASGSRSRMAAVQLKKAGFSAANLKGGIGAWNFSHHA
ncbi:MAG: rhodanese-like domain-containing protein [Acidobacteriota bacterium]